MKCILSTFKFSKTIKKLLKIKNRKFLDSQNNTDTSKYLQKSNTASLIKIYQSSSSKSMSS